MIRKILTSLISTSFEAVFIVLPGLIFAAVFLFSLGGSWYVWMSLLIIFVIYVILMESLKDKIVAWLENSKE